MAKRPTWDWQAVMDSASEGMREASSQRTSLRGLLACPKGKDRDLAVQS